VNPEQASKVKSWTPTRLRNGDGKYLFFRSNRRIGRSQSDLPVTCSDIIQMTDSPGNGWGDINWVDAGVIEELRPDDAAAPAAVGTSQHRAGD
jgi:hypothetical protein